MDLAKIPSKSTTARSYRLIPKWYLVKAHQVVIREVEAGPLAGDSTGYSYLRFVRWFDVRADAFRIRKGWVKLHVIVEIRTRVITDYMVTGSTAAYISWMYATLGRLGKGTGNFCLDSAYLARDMCDAIRSMGMVPRIKPKPNTVRNAKESQPWREMVCLYIDDRGAFDSEYHQRSAIETVFVALKKMYGDCTRCRNPENRAREIAIRAICYSVEPAARSHAKDGRLTPEMIATTAA